MTVFEQTTIHLKRWNEGESVIRTERTEATGILHAFATLALELRCKIKEAYFLKIWPKLLPSCFSIHIALTCSLAPTLSHNEPYLLEENVCCWKQELIRKEDKYTAKPANIQFEMSEMRFVLNIGKLLLRSSSLPHVSRGIHQPIKFTLHLILMSLFFLFACYSFPSGWPDTSPHHSPLLSNINIQTRQRAQLLQTAARACR